MGHRGADSRHARTKTGDTRLWGRCSASRSSAPRPAAGRRVSPAAIDRSSIDASIARMVFVNGFFAPHLSSLDRPAGRGDGDEPGLGPRRRGRRPRSRSSRPRPASMATLSTRSTPPWPRTALSFASRAGTVVDGLIELLFYSDGHGTPGHVQPTVDDPGRSGQPAGRRRNLRRARWRPPRAPTP